MRYEPVIDAEAPAPDEHIYGGTVWEKGRLSVRTQGEGRNKLYSLWRGSGLVLTTTEWSRLEAALSAEIRREEEVSEL
jgi:hypothetical protein